eukprot:m.29350 g.29350  ORF g.29350 m.29350 type:complete len:193 (-) comp16080_c0_seq1:184-762(-)
MGFKMRNMVCVFVLFMVVGMTDANIFFNREVFKIERSDEFRLLLQPDSACSEVDTYGSNQCTLEWGQTYNITFKIGLGQNLGASDRLTIATNFTLGLFPPQQLSTTCAVCGATCTVKIPGNSYKFSMPPCPIKPNMFSQTFPLKLPPTSFDPFKQAIKADGLVRIIDVNDTVLDAVTFFITIVGGSNATIAS